MPGFIGMPEILLLGLVVLLVFGPKRLPEMGRSMGRGFREFKDSITSDNNDENARFTVPADESETPALITPATGERTLSRFAREDEKVA